MGYANGGWGEREGERVLGLAGVCFVVYLGSCDSRFRHFRQVCGLFPPAGFVQILYLLPLLVVCFLFLFLFLFPERYVVCTYPV